MTSGRRVLVAWALALVTGTAAALLGGHAYRVVPRPHPLEELAYYPSGKFLEPATLGHSETVADLAWLRAVQYYGEHRLTDNRFDRMAHVFGILTTLAPKYIPAYVFGAFALAQEGRDFPAAEKLMLEGIERNPRSGRLAFEMGFLYYVRPDGRDLQRAAEYFELASYQPDGPPESRRFAAYARQNAGDLVVSYALWKEILQSTRNAYIQESARRELDRIARAMAEDRKDLAIRKLTTPRVVLGGP